MNLIKSTTNPFIILIKITVVLYVLHKLFFLIFGINQDTFFYKMEFIYLFFTFFSMLIMFILMKVKERDFDNVGMSFLLATTIKMLPCFLLLRSILDNNSKNNPIEKFNFFSLFIIFLTIETFLTIRILSKKD